MDYRDTLNLQKTDFPMRANLPEREPELVQWWEEIGLYQKVRDKHEDDPTWVLHDGPPYANGNIHLGQALNKILKDIAIKYKTMRGYDCPYIPGWDTQGLPTEQAVRAEMDVDRHDVSAIEWRRYCRELALKYVDLQREQFKRLGVRGDWDNPYLTLSKEYQSRQIEAFGKIALQGLVMRRLRPVYWCHSDECVTALAEDEIEYETRTSPAIYVAFALPGAEAKFELDEDLPDGASTEIVIWTTTPWTIPGNTGIALAERAQYVLLRAHWQQQERYLIVALALMDTVVDECDLQDVRIIGRAKGGDLEGLLAEHPIYDRQSKIVLADYVLMDQGTGCVHTAPGHGLEDFQTSLEYELDVVSPLDDYGRFTAQAGPELEGEVCDQANDIVLDLLRAENALLYVGQIQHEYPHCWRCHQPVIYRATKQWFMDIDKLRDEVLAQIGNVEWVPKWGQTRIEGMVQTRPDWCLSRQRVWGVPIPVFYCAECGEAILTEQTVKHVSELVAEHGADVWFEREAEDLVPAGTRCPQCGSESLEKESDILSVWFDSGASHYCVVRPNPELHYPADLYLEGDDQYQCWFQTSLWVAAALGDPAPFRTVVGHSFFVDETGQKMSKSKGNIISPQEIYDEYGADVLRLWFTYADFRQKMYCTEEIFEQVADAYRRIRNTARFFLTNLQDFDPAQDGLEFDELTPLDRWVLMRLSEIINRMTDAFDNWDLHLFYHDFHGFCATDLSAFYMDALKDTLYTDVADSHERRSAQTALWELLVGMTRLMAPVLTFTAEEVWQHCRQIDGSLPESSQLGDWPEPRDIDEEFMDRWRRFQKIRRRAMAALEEAKKQGVVEKPLEAHLDIYASPEAKRLLDSLQEPLTRLFIVSSVDVRDADASPVEVDERTQIHVEATLAPGAKCARCWVRSETVGQDPEHPELCKRCVHRI